MCKKINVIDQPKLLIGEGIDELRFFKSFLKHLNNDKISIFLLPSPDTNLAPEEKSVKWRKWLQSNASNHPPLQDEILHRDSIYEDEY